MDVFDCRSFGTVAIRDFEVRTLTVANTGNANAKLGVISDAAVGLSPPYVISAGTCRTGTVLTARGGSCTLEVTFTPLGVSQFDRALKIAYTGPSAVAQEAQRPITGKGTLDCYGFPPILNDGTCPEPSAVMAISGDPAFGSVAFGSYQEHTFTVTNNGNRAGQLGGIDSAGLGLSGPFALKGGTCASGRNLPAYGGSCTLVVRYTPPSAQASSSQALSVSYDYDASPAGQSVRATLTGKGVADCDRFPQPEPVCPAPQPLLQFSSASADYGNVPVETVADVTVTVYNRGKGSANVGAVTGLGAPFSVVGGSCVTDQAKTQVLPPAGSCTLAFRFSPTAIGTFSGRATLPYANAKNVAQAPATINLYAGSVIVCQVPTLAPTYRQGVADAQAVNASQAAKGTADGERSGYTAGYNLGYQETYQKIYQSVYSQAYKVAYNTAYNSGYNSGSSLGCSDGTSYGASDGIKAAKADGYDDGYNDGYDDGYDDGHATGSSDGYNQGYLDGQDSCWGEWDGSSERRGSAGGGSRAAPYGALAQNRSELTARLLAPTFNNPNQQACYTQAYGKVLNPNAYKNAFDAASSVSGTAYKSGRKDGVNVATSDATRAGNIDGQSDGARIGKADGTNDGYDSGYDTCYLNQYNTSYGQQYPGSYNSGYFAGSDDGFYDGYDSGYSDGTWDGIASCAQAAPASRKLLGRAASDPTKEADVVPRSLARVKYGEGLTRVASVNGLKIDIYVSSPVLHGIEANAQIRVDARKRAGVLDRPSLRFKALQRQVQQAKDLHQALSGR